MSSEEHKRARTSRLVEVLEKFVEVKVQEMFSKGDGIHEAIALEDWRKELRVVLHDAF